MRVLITGGAGFVGSHLAFQFKESYATSEVYALDNLKRRGSELNLNLLRERGIVFVHGDVRNVSDLSSLPGDFDLVVDASAEPSVLSGQTGSPSYVLDTNLGGTLNCLEFARLRAKRFLFLSTSRVYSLKPLQEISLYETDSRFEIRTDTEALVLPGLSERGVSESFPVNSARSLYGGTKLASEIIVQEYSHLYGLPALINRCGVIAGPGQFGKVDQGVFTFWVARHHFSLPLGYTGFGGSGKQVRDLLHPHDLFDLIQAQLGVESVWKGEVFNVGGGREISTSLKELTELCQRLTGNRVPITPDPRTHLFDVPLYLSDCRKAEESFGWSAKRSVETIVEDIRQWISVNESLLKPIFGM